VPPIDAKHTQRTIKSDNRHQQRLRYSSARVSIRRRHNSHDPFAGRSQRGAHESRPATSTADPPATYTTARADPPPERPIRHKAPPYISPTGPSRRHTADTRWLGEFGTQIGLGFSEVFFIVPLHRLYFFGVGGIRFLLVRLGRPTWPSPAGFRRGFFGRGGGPPRRPVIESTVLWRKIPSWALP